MSFEAGTIILELFFKHGSVFLFSNGKYFIKESLNGQNFSVLEL